MNWERELYGNGLASEVEPILVKLKDNFPFVDFTKVRFTYLRENATRTMGNIKYHPDGGTAEIAIHPRLDGADLKEAITHELAHFISWKWKGERHHGYYWGFVMILHGFEAKIYALEGIAQRVMRGR